MAIQFIDYTTSGATADTGDTTTAAIHPLADGEAAIAANFNRGPENLRVRTEALRSAINDLKYVTDADKALVLTSSGAVTWTGTVSSGGTGKFSLGTGGTMTVRPFMAPVSSKRPGVYADSGFNVVLGFSTSAAFHAYEGGNQYTVTFVIGASFGVVLSGTPANDLTVTVVAGTTPAALVALLNGNGTFSSFGGGCVATQLGVLGTSITGLLYTTPQRFIGALDAERHVIQQSDLDTFFLALSGSNILQEGDTVGLYFPTMYDGAGNGRREAVPDSKAGGIALGGGLFNNVNISSGTLFNNRVSPEKAALAIPLCTVVNNNLVFLNQVTLVPGQPQVNMTAGFVQRAGDTMTGPLAVTPTYSAATNLLSITVPTYTDAGLTIPSTAANRAIGIAAGTGAGIAISGTSAGNLLTVSNAGAGISAKFSNSAGASVLVAATFGNNSLSADFQGYSLNTPVLRIGNYNSAATSGAQTLQVLNGSGSISATPTHPSTAQLIAFDHLAYGLEIQPTGSGAGAGGIGLSVSAPPGVTAISGYGILANAAAGTAVAGAYPTLSDNGAAIRATTSVAYAPALSVVASGAATSAMQLSGVAAQFLTIRNTANNTASGSTLLSVDALRDTSNPVTGVNIVTRSSATTIATTDTSLYVNSGFFAGNIPSNTGRAAYLGGVVFVDYGGSTVTDQLAALQINCNSTVAAPMLLSPVTNAFPSSGAYTAGAMGMETFNGTSARLRSVVTGGLGVGTGTKNYISVSPWTATANSLYYWVDVEGVVHLRGMLNNTGTTSFTSGTPVTLSGVIPVVYRPTGTERSGTAVAIATTAYPCTITLTSTGDLSFTQWSGGTLAVSLLIGIQMDWPLF